MPQLNPIAPKKLIALLVRLGFHLLRSKGSHFFYRNTEGRTTVVPVHGGEEISVGLLKKILRDVGLSIKEYDVLIKR